MNAPSQTKNYSISPQVAAQELLNRRIARKKFTNYCEYVFPDEPPAEHHRLICDELDNLLAIQEGEQDGPRNLMIFAPPGSAKSSYSSKRFPPYYLGRFPKKSIICASYGADLATSFGRKVRNTVSSQESRNLFPDLILAEDQQAKGEWETKDGGFYFAIGVGGGVTGRRCDLGLIDDPVKGRKEADSIHIQEDTWNWYNTDFLTRLKPNAIQIIIQTRWTENDLSGRILPEDWTGESGVFQGRDGKQWKVVCLQAQAEEGKNDPLGRNPGEWLWTDWFSEQYWKETKTSQQNADVRNWSALYQQRPSPEDGTFFKREWFNRFHIEQTPKHLTKFGAADYAVTDDGGDFTEQGVAGVDPESNLYIIDWISCQSEADQWVEDLINLHVKHDMYLFGAEKGQIRRAVAPFLRRRQQQRRVWFGIEEMPHIGDKAANARAFQALAKSGKVYIPLTEWGNALLDQLLRFPAGVFDDKVDTCGIMGRLIDRIYDAIIPQKKEKKRDRWDEAFARDDEYDDWKTV